MPNRCGGPLVKKTQLKIHERQRTTACPLYKLDKKGPIDRRETIYRGQPQQDHTQVHGLVKYITQKIQWGRTKCNYKVKPQDKAKIIQHSLKTIKNHSKTIQKKKT